MPCKTMMILTDPHAMQTNENIDYQSRVQTIDLLRGVVIILMSLDHTRDFLGPTLYDALDLSHTTVVLFFTRWITNLCAPTFVFLTGVGAYLFGQKHSKKELSLYLLKRGIFLMLLDATFVSYCWSFEFFPEIDFQVIWVIGLSMLTLALMIHLPQNIILAAAIIMIACHDFFDVATPLPHSGFLFLWSILHVPHHFDFQYIAIHVSYPLIPWPGIMWLGYSLGAWIQQPPAVRTKYFCVFGLICLSLFCLLRGINIYGDSVPWHVQARGGIYTFLSFITVSKYPPSLLYVLINIGIVSLLWPLWENWRGFSSRIVITFGKVALFFYLLHLFFLHAFAELYSRLYLHVPGGWWWNESAALVFPSNYHYSLGRVYVIWISVLIALYPLCYYYKNYKNSHSYPWLKYL
jgi:uncharacterized membrane protein